MATAISKLQIVVDILGDSRQTKGIQDSLKQIAVIAGTVVAAGYAAKKAWDFTKEGAQLELTAQQFENVANNAGMLPDVLLNEMRAATDGLVSDADLIASGLQIIELGLADSQTGVVDLATVVSRLGLDMQQVIMTFANNSEMRLDALGLSVEGVKDRVAELNAEGFDGDAFDQAVLDGLIERMEVLGDTSETTAGQMQSLEVAIQNTIDRSKELSSTTLGPVIRSTASYVNTLNALEEAYNNNYISMDEYRRLSINLGSDLDKNAEVIDHLNILIEEYTESFKSSNQEISKVPALMSQAESAYLSTHAAVHGLAIESEIVWENTMSGAQRTATAVTSLAGTFGNVGNQASGAITPVGNLLDGIDSNIASPISAFISDLEWMISTGGEFEQAFQDIQDADLTPEVRLETMQSLLTHVEDAQDAIGSDDSEGLAGAMAGLNDIQLDLQQLDDAKQRSEDFMNYLDENVGKSRILNIDVWYNIHGQQPSHAGSYAPVPGAGAPVVPIEDTGGGGGLVGATAMPGASGSGGTVNWYGDAIFTSSDAAMDFISQMQMQSTRSGANSAAGANYVG